MKTEKHARRACACARRLLAPCSRSPHRSRGAQQPAWQPDMIGGPWRGPGPGPQPQRPARGHPQPARDGRHQRAWRRTRRTPTSSTWARSTAASGGPRTRRPPARLDAAHGRAVLALHRPRRAAVRPDRPTRNTLVAGQRPLEQLRSNGGARIGMLRTTDGGDHLDRARRAAACCTGKNATGVAARGAVAPDVRQQLQRRDRRQQHRDLPQHGHGRDVHARLRLRRAAAGPHLRPGGGPGQQRRSSTRASATPAPPTASTSPPTPAPPGRASATPR